MTALYRNTPDDGRRLLGECILFEGLAAEQRRALVARSRIRKLAADETVFLMGSPGDSMMAVLSGHVRISVPSPDGKEIVLAILRPGEIFGEIALLDGKERTADARAATDCSLAILERRDVLSFFDQYPSSWLRLVEVLCERLRQTDRQMAEVALLGLPVRLAKAVLRMAAFDSQSASGGAAGQVRLSQRELGNLVGATRESVNKCLREWQRKGVVRIAESLITIVDRPALEELAELVEA
jgi:CRP/FNR family cyclic AMP-dependent transcriptional regulator